MALSKPISQTILDKLSSLLEDRISTNPSVRDTHGKDESWHHPHRPDIVVFPKTTDEVSEVVKICSEFNIPVIAYGT